MDLGVLRYSVEFSERTWGLEAGHEIGCEI